MSSNAPLNVVRQGRANMTGTYHAIRSDPEKQEWEMIMMINNLVMTRTRGS
jgi:hypothetical protein